METLLLMSDLFDPELEMFLGSKSIEWSFVENNGLRMKKQKQNQKQKNSTLDDPAGLISLLCLWKVWA